MSVPVLVAGLLTLAAVLGLLGFAAGLPEYLVWLAAVAAWLLVWARSRHDRASEQEQAPDTLGG